MPLFDDVNSWITFIVRLIAAVGGFVVGYLTTGPVWRLFWRGVFRKPIPPALLPWMKVCTGLVFAALLYTAVHLGGGGGFGWGGGSGSGVGPGTGSGKDSGKDSGSGKDGPTAKVAKDKGKRISTKNPGREILEIELVGPKRYPGEQKFYLLDRKDPPVDLDAIEDVLKKRADAIELHLIYTIDSVDRGHGAAERLRSRADAYRIPMVQIDDLPRN